MRSRTTPRATPVRAFATALFTFVAVLTSCGEASDSVTRPEPTAPAGPQGAPIAGQIAFVSTRDRSPYIYVANSDGSNARRITPGERPAWSADGRRLAFHRWSGGAAGSGVLDLSVINADGSNEMLLTQGANPTWSPDGTRIAFNYWVGAQGGIAVMNADGSGVTRTLITHEFARAPGWEDHCVCSPRWSPDGRTIAFVRANYEDPWWIYVMNADGSEPRRLNDDGWSKSEPAWSPDGRSIAYEWPGGIASVGVNGSGMRVHVGGGSFDPDWSPDGRSLLFNKFSSPTHSRIFVVAIDDGQVRQLIPEAVAPALPNYGDYQAAWSRMTANR